MTTTQFDSRSLHPPQAGPAAFRLIRRCDGLTYHFDAATTATATSAPAESPVFRRRDRPVLTVAYDTELGWCGRSPCGAVTAMVWGMAPARQPRDAPPAGPWISAKHGRSYVYDLLHGSAAAAPMHFAHAPGCAFCGIAAGTATAHVIAETPTLIAFADTSPIREGHVQVIPRAHHRLFDDMPGPLAAEVLGLGQRIARAQKWLYGAPRVGFVFSGHEVDHVHAHLIPLHGPDDLTSLRYFDLPEGGLTRRDMGATEGALRATAAQLGTALSEAP